MPLEVDFRKVEVISKDTHISGSKAALKFLKQDFCSPASTLMLCLEAVGPCAMAASSAVAVVVGQFGGVKSFVVYVQSVTVYYHPLTMVGYHRLRKLEPGGQ